MDHMNSDAEFQLPPAIELKHKSEAAKLREGYRFGNFTYPDTGMMTSTLEVATSAPNTVNVLREILRSLREEYLSICFHVEELDHESENTYVERQYVRDSISRFELDALLEENEHALLNDPHLLTAIFYRGKDRYHSWELQLTGLKNIVTYGKTGTIARTLNDIGLQHVYALPTTVDLETVAKTSGETRWDTIHVLNEFETTLRVDDE